MPSPIGHVVGALTLRNLALSELSLAETSVLAILPDADFLVGPMTDSKTEEGHGLVTHSFLAALLVGTSWALVRRREGYSLRAAAEAAAVYGSHLFLDALGKDQKDGLPLFWPLSSRRYAFKGSVFETIRRTPGRAFLPGLWNRINRRAVKRELERLLPLLALSTAVRVCRRR
jgi:membrane-bound metal-dependent hydrolase YbcI (DUF457 family)